METEGDKKFWRMVYAFRQKYNTHELTIPDLVRRIEVLRSRLASKPWGICKEQRKLWRVALYALSLEWGYRKREFCESGDIKRFGD